MESQHNDLASGTQAANILRASGELDETRAFTEIHLTDGRVLRLNTRALEPVAVVEVDAAQSERPDEERILVPLIEEQLHIGRRTVVTGKVLLEKTVQEYNQQLNEPLALLTYDIERKIVNQVIETVPVVRQEGDITIYPVIEEQLILTKQLILKEEIYVTRRDDERIDTQVVTLKREHLNVQRESVPRD